jgi:hypothetical protein
LGETNEGVVGIGKQEGIEVVAQRVVGWEAGEAFSLQLYEARGNEAESQCDAAEDGEAVEPWIGPQFTVYVS